MSKDEVRRSSSAASTPPAPAPAPVRRSVEPAQAERFQRALLPLRRMEARLPRRERPAVDERTRPSIEPSPSDLHDDYASSPLTAVTVKGVPPPNPSIQPPAEGSDDLDGLTPGLGRIDPTTRPPPMPLPGAVPISKALVIAVARAICAVYEMADASFQSWTVMVPLRQDILPDTQLRMTLAPHHLLLRFSAEAPASHRLVFANRRQLIDMLLKALGNQCEIDIELT